MKTNKEVLSSILKTAQMGQIGICCVQKNAQQPALQQALRDQLKQYDTVEAEAYSLACQRGWKLPEISRGAKTMAKMAVRSRLTGSNTDSKIAAMMINGNTRGIIKGLKNSHRHIQPDSKVTALSQKLLEYENQGIQAMKPYL